MAYIGCKIPAPEALQLLLKFCNRSGEISAKDYVRSSMLLGDVAHQVARGDISPERGLIIACNNGWRPSILTPFGYQVVITSVNIISERFEIVKSKDELFIGVEMPIQKNNGMLSLTELSKLLDSDKINRVVYYLEQIGFKASEFEIYLDKVWQKSCIQ